MNPRPPKQLWHLQGGLPADRAVESPMPKLKMLVWLYFILLIVEGALRKWIVPQLSTPLLVVRDPVVIAIYYLALRHGIFPSGPFIQSLKALALLSLLLGLVQTLNGSINLGVLLYGWRTDFLHLPLIFLLPRIFNRADIEKIGKVILWIALPMALLMAYQFRSPPEAWINKTVGLGEGRQLSSALGKIRPAGTFSFVTGPVAFLALVAAFLSYGFQRREVFSKLLLGAGFLALGLALAVSGSRGALFTAGLVFSAAILAYTLSRETLANLSGLVLFLAIAFFILSQVEVFKEGTEVLSVRWDLASGAEASEGGMIGRYLRSLFAPFFYLPGVPFLGYGLGLGTNAGAALLTGSSQFLLSEGEWGRILFEMGPVLGLWFIVYRIFLTISLGTESYRRGKQGETLPLALFGAAGLNVWNGQLAQPTNLGFAVLSAGLCLAAIRSPIIADASPPDSEAPPSSAKPQAGRTFSRDRLKERPGLPRRKPGPRGL